nr:initiation-specific alpha-1,6-mannosyltransferase [Quercus suber]
MMMNYKRSLVLATFILLSLVGLLRTRLSSPRLVSPKSLWNAHVEGQEPVDNTHARLVQKLSAVFPYDPEPDFPARIWQTWKMSPLDKGFDYMLSRAQTTWARLNRDFHHEIVLDSAAATLIHDVYAEIPEIYHAYDALPKPVLKADFFRYLVLLARGGVYSDIDTTALKPVSSWVPSEFPTKSYGLVIGIEADPDRPDWQDWYARRIQFCQWTIQSKPGHPVLVDVVASIAKETLQRQASGKLSKADIKDVMDFTGPGVWTDAIFKFFDQPSVTGNITWHKFANLTQPIKVADIVVLPITSFSPDVGHMGSKPSSDPMAYAEYRTHSPSQLSRNVVATRAKFNALGPSPGATVCDDRAYDFRLSYAVSRKIGIFNFIVAWQTNKRLESQSVSGIEVGIKTVMDSHWIVYVVSTSVRFSDRVIMSGLEAKTRTKVLTSTLRESFHASPTARPTHAVTSAHAIAN